MYASLQQQLAGPTVFSSSGRHVSEDVVLHYFGTYLLPLM